jgi:hypothetical protein
MAKNCPPVLLAKYLVPGSMDTVAVRIIGYEDRETGEFEHYDLFVTPPEESPCVSVHLNEGETLTEWPTYEVVLQFWQDFSSLPTGRLGIATSAYPATPQSVTS